MPLMYREWVEVYVYTFLISAVDYVGGPVWTVAENLVPPPEFLS
jgi:hypothetical protein